MARAKQKDFLDLPDAGFDQFFQNLLSYVTAKCAGGTGAAWTHIPAEALTALNSAYTAWHTAFVKMAGPHTKIDTEEKNDSRKAAEREIRGCNHAYLRYHPAVTNEDRTAMNLHVNDTTKSKIPVPATRCLVTDLKNLGGFRVEIRFQDEATPESRAIPYGMNGALLNSTWGPEKVTDYALLKDSRLMTENAFVVQLPPEAEAKFLSLACRWQNSKGELGPWSEIMYIAVS
jgi:hypothetical protein